MCEMDEVNEKEMILSQWQTCVEMANSVSQRRDTTNGIFITINLALIAAVSYKFDFMSIFVLTAGIALCVLWRVIINNYKYLNKVKFEVINDLEKNLPVKPYTNEWEKLDKLKESKKYRDGTKLEAILPIFFVVLYAVAIIIIVVGSKC